MTRRAATFSHAIFVSVPPGFSAGDVFPVELDGGEETIYVMLPAHVTSLAPGEKVEIEVHRGLPSDSLEVDLSTWGVVVSHV